MSSGSSLQVPRQRKSTKEVLGQLYNDPPQDFPKLPIPGKVPSDYTRDKVLQGLVYASERLRNSKRKLSPLGELAIKKYEAACHDALNAETPEERMPFIADLRVYETAISAERMLQGADKPTAQIYQDELLRWRRLEFYARYGDYFKYACDELRQQNKPSLVIIKSSEKWSDIVLRLQAEKDKWQFMRENPRADVPVSEVQTHMAISTACNSLGWDFNETLETIKLYADRNSLFHSDLLDLIKSQDYNDLSEQLFQDLKDVDATLDASEELSKVILKKIIRALICEYYETEGVGVSLDKPQSWGRRPKLGEKSRALAEKDKRKDDIAARLEAMRLEKDAAEAEKEAEDLYAFLRAEENVKIWQSIRKEVDPTNIPSDPKKNRKCVASSELPEGKAKKQQRRMEDFKAIVGQNERLESLMKSFKEGFHD